MCADSFYLRKGLVLLETHFHPHYRQRPGYLATTDNRWQLNQMENEVDNPSIEWIEVYGDYEDAVSGYSIELAGADKFWAYAPEGAPLGIYSTLGEAKGRCEVVKNERK